MRRRSLLVAAMLAAGVSSLAALDVSDTGRFTLVSGSLNGQGKVFDGHTGVHIEGEWSAGRTLPERAYRVSHSKAPSRDFEQFYDENGHLVRGVELLAAGSLGRVLPHFEGEFARRYHDAANREVTVLARGVYRNGVGLEYRGEFSYLPAAGFIERGIVQGYYLFYGDLVDVEEGDETETGLFLSDATLPGAMMRFYRADAEYLALFQEKLRGDLQDAQVRAANRQERQRRFEFAMSLINVAAQAYGGQLLAGQSGGLGGGSVAGLPLGGLVGGGGGAGGNPLGALLGGGSSGGRGQFALGLVQSVLNTPGETQPESLKDMAVRSLVNAGMGKLVEDPEFAEQLSGLVTESLK